MRQRSRILFAAGPPVAAALVGGLAARHAPAIYERLDKPAWAPPARVFGPAWSALYVLVGVAGWRVSARRNPLLSALHLAQMGLNAGWTPAFFVARRRRAALAICVGLDAMVAVELGVLARRGDRRSAALLSPYLGWCVFATALTAAVSDPSKPPTA